MSTSVVGGPTFHEDPEEESESVKFFDPPKVVKNRRVAAEKAGKVVLAASGRG
jgi:hypothetical protein